MKALRFLNQTLITRRLQEMVAYRPPLHQVLADIHDIKFESPAACSAG